MSYIRTATNLKNELINLIVHRVRYLIKDGFFHILGSSFINKCIAFITNVLLVKTLTKNDYGVFTAAFNIFFIFSLFSGFGITSGILYFCSKNISRSEKVVFYKYAIRFGLVSEIILSLAMLFYGLFGPVGIEEARSYILGLSIMPFAAFLYDYYSIVLRAEKDNKKYSLLLNLNSTLYAVLGVLGGLLLGIWGTIVGRYLAYILSDVVGWRFCVKYTCRTSEQLLEAQRSDLLRYSVKAGITSALNVILYRIDVYVIGLVVADASVLASYKVGATLPENMNFIPQCIMVYFLPVFIQNLSDKEWIRKKTKEIFALVGGVSFFIGFVLLTFAPLIIRIIWGESYLDAVPCFRILAVSFVILSTFRMTSTNILLALKRTGYAMLISIVTGVSNIVFDVILTMRYGSIGTAYATLFVTIIASVLSFPFVLYSIYTGRYEYN